MPIKYFLTCMALLSAMLRIQFHIKLPRDYISDMHEIKNKMNQPWLK